MKIHGNKPPENHNASRSGKADRPADGSAARDGSAPLDGVEPSGRMGKIEELKQLVRQLPETREHLVVTIKAAIEEGTYEVDSLNVAGRILQELA